MQLDSFWCLSFYKLIDSSNTCIFASKEMEGYVLYIPLQVKYSQQKHVYTSEFMTPKRRHASIFKLIGSSNTGVTVNTHQLISKEIYGYLEYVPLQYYKSQTLEWT